jgi:signal peptidase I
MTEDTLKKDIALREKSRLRENVEAILVAILLALFIRTFVVQAFKIPSGSMKDTLLIGDHILVNKFIYGVKLPYLQKVIIPFKHPQRGDIIVFKFPIEPEKDFIKRVVGVAGDVIEGHNKTIYVNGKPLVENYTKNTDPHIFPAGTQARDNFGPITVPEHSLFVMGDNRDQSFDSRFWGFVPEENLVGKAFIIWLNWDINGKVFDVGRIGNGID